MRITEIEGHTFLTEPLNADSVIIDLGANAGRFTAAILNQFKCDVVSIEPNPHHCNGLQSLAPRHVFNLAIGGTSRHQLLHLHSNSESSTLCSRDGANETVSVSVISLEELVRRIGLRRVDLVKVDIEGAEIEMFDGCSDEFLKGISQFTIEFHDFNGLVDAREVRRVLARLERLGFYCVNLWRTSFGDVLCVNQAKIRLSMGERIWLSHVTRKWRMVRGVYNRLLRRRAS